MKVINVAGKYIPLSDLSRRVVHDPVAIAVCVVAALDMATSRVLSTVKPGRKIGPQQTESTPQAAKWDLGRLLDQKPGHATGSELSTSMSCWIRRSSFTVSQCSIRMSKA